MAKVLFINPVVREEDVPRHVPYGLALLAAIAVEKGHLVQVFDANAWRLGEGTLREVLAADAWDAIAMGGMTTTYGSVKKIVAAAREVCPAATIVLGGGILTSLPRDMMRLLPGVDVGCVGEGFATFPEILQMIDAGRRAWAEIPGTISRAPDGELILAPPRALLHDLDSLPYPAWDLFPIEEIYFKNSEVLYSEEGMMARRRLDINASYGCSLICRFCYHLGIAGDMRYEDDGKGGVEVAFDKPGVYTRAIRYHSPAYIVRMVKHVHDKYGVDFVTFLDENLMTMDQSSGRVWLAEICRLWHEYGLAPVYRRDDEGNVVDWTGVHWSGTSHATLCTKEILKAMRRAGCSHLVYGYESFAPHVMKTIGKGATPETNIRSFFWTLEAGIRPVPNQIIGFPNEDFDSIRTSMEAWKKLGITVKPHFATPYPGSEWFTVYRQSILDQYGGDLEAFILDLGDASKISAVISHNFTAVELIGLRDLMLNFDTRKIDAYEKIWRAKHAIPEGRPSTVYAGPMKAAE
ncbi:MAG: cobalamin-dependent protein [Rhodospirillales bacterium]|nr:cobalamin-dependent protein [Rhodospirillales bacterium]